MSEPNKTIAQKSEELDNLVAWFDSEDFSVEAAIDKFKQAEKLAASIEKDLLTIKNEVKIIKKNMFALLNKPGYEKESEAIKAKL
jgi:exonuclease VII small subunit